MRLCGLRSDLSEGWDQHLVNRAATFTLATPLAAELNSWLPDSKPVTHFFGSKNNAEEKCTPLKSGAASPCRMSVAQACSSPLIEKWIYFYAGHEYFCSGDMGTTQTCLDGSWLRPDRMRATHLHWSSIRGKGMTCHGSPMKDRLGCEVQTRCW